MKYCSLTDIGLVRERNEDNFSTIENKNSDILFFVCDGILTLDGNGLHFRGTENGNEFNFDLATNEVPTFGMCTDITRFYTFVQGEFIEFFPDSRDVLRWDHLVEEMHRYKGGSWQNTNYRHNE